MIWQIVKIIYCIWCATSWHLNSVEERNCLAAIPQTTQSTVYECSPITIGIRCKEGSLHPYDRITCRERNTKPEEEVPRHASKYNRTTSLESGFVWQCKADYIRILHLQWQYQLSSSVTFNISIFQFHFFLTLPAVSAIFISLWCRVQIRDQARTELITCKFCFVKLICITPKRNLDNLAWCSWFMKQTSRVYSSRTICRCFKRRLKTNFYNMPLIINFFYLSILWFCHIIP